jgi:hypothetical protein
MVASVGTTLRSGVSRRAPNAARTGWGASVAHSAIAVIDRGAGTHRGSGQGQDRNQRMAEATAGSRVRDRGEVGEQMWGFTGAERAGVGELGERGRGYDQG